MVTYKKSLEQEIKEFAARRERERSMPPPKPLSAMERLTKARERLDRVEVTIGRSDQARIRLLLRAARLASETEDWLSVHGYASEIVQLSRTRVLGVREAHPVLSSWPSPPSLPSGETQ